MSPRLVLLAISIAVAALVIPAIALAGEESGPERGERACQTQEPSSGSGGRGGGATVLLAGPNHCTEPGAPKGCPTSGGWSWATVQNAEDNNRDKNRDAIVCKRPRRFESQPPEVVDNYVVNGSFSCNNPQFCNGNRRSPR